MSLSQHPNRSSMSVLPSTKKNQKDSSKLLPNLYQQEQDAEKDSILQTWEEIEQIRRENKELKEELETENRMHHINGPVLEAKMEQIQDMSSAIAQKIELESQKKRDLESLIMASQESINMNVKKLNENNGVALPQLQQRIKTLEYKLEKTRGRHNESLASINMLKEDVNMVRRERVIFSNVFKKLESDIKLKDEEFKKYMIEKMHISEKKKSLLEDLQNIKARAKKEVQNFKSEYQSIFNSTKQQQNNNNSITQDNEYTSNNKRIFDTEIILNHESTSKEKSFPSILNNSTLNQTAQQKSILAGNKSMLSGNTPQNNLSNNSQNLQATQEELERYQFMFQKVQKEVGIEDLDTLIYLFENIDKENNNLYESANSKSDDIDKLEKEIRDVDKEIQKYSKHKTHKQTSSVSQDKQKLDLQRIQKKIDTTEANTKSYESDISTVQAKLIKIAEKFNIPKPAEDNGDGNSFLTFLQNVEKRVNDIINLSLFSEGKVVNIDRKRQSEGTFSNLPKKETSNTNGIGSILDGIKKKSETEAERILNKADFSLTSKEEIKQFKDSKSKNVAMSASTKGKKVKA